MPESRPVVAPNPHALRPAAEAAARRLSACVMLGDEARGVWPLRIGRVWPGVPALRGPRHPVYDLNGGPHLSGPQLSGPDALRGMLDAGRLPKAWPRLIAASAVTAEGPAWDALTSMAGEGRIGLHVLARWDRALLERAAASGAEDYFERFQSSEQRKALRRKRRRLSEAGALQFTIHEEPAGVAAALETFCRIETAGWKGRAGTALSQDPDGHAYVADVLADMARHGSAFAAVLTAGGEPLAAGLFLRAGGEVLFWKTAYDERQAKHSPGVIFDVMLTEWLYRQPWFERLDAGHDDSVDPATLIWRQRRPMANLLVDLSPGSLAGRLAVVGLTLRGRLRSLKARYAAK